MLAKVTVAGALAAFVLAQPASAADADLHAITVNAGPLSRALQEIARQTGVQLLFDGDVVRGRQASRMSIRATAFDALQSVLAGTDLRLRRATSGALMVEAAAPEPLARQDVAVPELLVVGRRSQNTDIRRQETDIQPYRVFTGVQITAAHADDVGQYFDTRVPAQGLPRPLGINSALGATNSEIDLRGLGTDSTLILVDGRRMPAYSAAALGLSQPDLNAVPQHAIDRIETITGAASGIYGFNALGGVVNVVLARDRPGVEAHLTTGISARGDAARMAFEGRLEFSPDDGATDILMHIGIARGGAVTEGRSGYLTRDRRVSYAINPTQYLSLFSPNGNSIAIQDVVLFENLVFKPEFGGQPLGSKFTYLPSGFEGSMQDLRAALLAHAGQVDLGLSQGEKHNDVTASPRTRSLIANLRHDFGSGVQAYADAIMLWNHGRYVSNALNSVIYLPSSSPYNPFQQDVFVNFPLTEVRRTGMSAYDSSRFTFGLVAPLAFDWRATAEAVVGRTRFRQSIFIRRDDPSSADDANPFGSWTAFQAALHGHARTDTSDTNARSRYQEQSLRVAGPVLQTKAGPATLSLAAERRRERAPSYDFTGTGDGSYGAGPVAGQTTTSTAVSAELRAPIFGAEAPVSILRGLEAQVAARHDRQVDDFAEFPTDPESARLHIRSSGISYTAGLKVTPAPWLMLRASFATGQAPAPPAYRVAKVDPLGIASFSDPKRGGGAAQYILFTETTGGSPDLENIRANTASVGAVLSPFGPQGPRVSLDYARIHKTHDVELLYADLVLAHEDAWPERVQRGPLSDADRARGYTAGPVTALDSRAFNGVSRDVRTLDGRFDWTVGLPLGSLHLYADASYNLHNVGKARFKTDLPYKGRLDAPLVWRGNSGLDWWLGTLTIGANLRYYGRYSTSVSSATENDLFNSFQGSDHVPSQAYLDLRLAKRLPLPGVARGRELQVDLGVGNVLDTAPPRYFAEYGLGDGYSAYGDPRRRRVEMTLSALF